MMNIIDIIQLIILCAVIMLPLGYSARRWLPRLLQRFRQRFLAPRYLKSAGVLQRTSSVTVNRQNDDKH